MPVTFGDMALPTLCGVGQLHQLLQQSAQLRMLRITGLKRLQEPAHILDLRASEGKRLI